ncbi:MAG: hypothetical protein ACE149_15195 [Armatimonadota bacterium]
MLRTRRAQRLAILLVVVGVALCVWLLWPRPSDENLILETVARAEHGVETKNADEIMGCVARDYHDPSGLSRIDIFRLAAHWQRTSEQAEVTVDSYQLDIKSPNATGKLEVEVLISAGGEVGRPERMSLTVEFERERSGLFGKKWLVRSVSGHGFDRSFEGLM